MSVTRGFIVGVQLGHLQHHSTEMQKVFTVFLMRFLTPVLPDATRLGALAAGLVHVARLIEDVRRAAEHAGLDPAELATGVTFAEEIHAEMDAAWQATRGRGFVVTQITDPPRIPRTPIHAPEEDAR